MRRGGYAFFASRRCDIFTADLCNSIMPKRFQSDKHQAVHLLICTANLAGYELRYQAYFFLVRG